MFKRVVLIAFLISLGFCIKLNSTVHAQDCQAGCAPVCESETCSEFVVAHLGKYHINSSNLIRTPTKTPTITNTPIATSSPTITSMPGLIIYLNTTPDLAKNPVFEASLTPQPSITITKQQETSSPIISGSIITQQLSTLENVDQQFTPTPFTSKNVFEIGSVTFQQWVLLFREALKNPVWVTVVVILLVLIGISIIGRIITKIKDTIRSARGVIGPIQVVENEGNPGITSNLYKYLAECGAMCQDPVKTSAPSATPGFSGITAVLKEVASLESKIIMLILEVFYFIVGITAYKKSGYSITSILSGSEENKNIKLQVTINLINGNKFKESRTFSGESIEKIVQEAAYWIFWYVSGRRKTRTFLAPWMSFPTFESFYKYKMAQQELDLEKALTNFKFASDITPFNAAIRLSWGDKNELNNRYIEAMKIYVEGAMMWPHLVSFWYRIAVILDCYRDWESEIIGDSQIEKKENLEALLQRICMMLNVTFECENQFCLSTTAVLKLADSIWNSIESTLHKAYYSWIDHSFIFNLSPHYHNENSPFLAKYYFKLIPFFSWQEATKFQKAIFLVHNCTRVEILLEEQSHITTGVANKDNLSIEKLDYQVKQIVEGPWNSMTIFYNAACYYSLRSGILFENKNFEFKLENNPKPLDISKNTKFIALTKMVQSEDIFIKYFSVENILFANSRTVITKNEVHDAALCITNKVPYSEILEMLNLSETNEYHDVIQYFNQLILNESVKDYYLSEAIKFLKIAFKFPSSYLTLDWVKNDPDLNPLWRDIEFQALFDIPPQKTHKDYKKEECKEKIDGLKALISICKAIAQNGTYPHSAITPELLMTVSKIEINLWESLSDVLRKPDKKSLIKKFEDIANQFPEIKIGIPSTSNRLNQEPLSSFNYNKVLKSQIDYFLIFEEITHNCDQLSINAQNRVEDWNNKLEASKLFMMSERVPDLVDVWKLWESARRWQWISMENEITIFVEDIQKSIFAMSEKNF